jgi:hypothetical protein
MTFRILVSSALRLSLAAALTQVLACGAPAPGATDSALDAAELGTLVLALAAADGSGRHYRLSDAELVVQPVGPDAGPATIVLRSNDAPDADRLERRLVPGRYVIDLQPGWQLLDVTGGAEQPVPALLLSPESVRFTIQRFRTSFVGYHFGANGGELEFGGKLSVGISVISVDAGAP